MSIRWPESEEQAQTGRGMPTTLAGMALFASMAAGISLAVLVFTTDPGQREEELFAGLLLVLAGGLSSTAMLLFGRRTESPLADTLRAFRRGLLFGLACSGAMVLRMNAALSLPNLGFLLLLLLIAETIFLAQRQHPA